MSTVLLSSNLSSGKGHPVGKRNRTGLKIWTIQTPKRLPIGTVGEQMLRFTTRAEARAVTVSEHALTFSTSESKVALILLSNTQR